MIFKIGNNLLNEFPSELFCLEFFTKFQIFKYSIYKELNCMGDNLDVVCFKNSKNVNGALKSKYVVEFEFIIEFAGILLLFATIDDTLLFN